MREFKEEKKRKNYSLHEEMYEYLEKVSVMAQKKMIRIEKK